MSTKALNPYRVEWSKFASGERMPFLVSRETGLPLEAPTFWIIAERRALGFQPNTLENELRALSFLYLWADARGVNIGQRLSEGIFFSLSEIMDLANFCGHSVADAVEQITPRASNVVSLQAKRKERATVQSGEKRNRLGAIRAFVEFTSADILSQLTRWPNRWDHYNSVRSECLNTIDGQKKGLSRRSRDDLGRKEGLDEDIIKRLREVIEPDYAENPFEPEVRFRNYLIILLLLNLGIRRGELCGLMVPDCNLGSKGTVTVHRRPDDPLDPRRDKPATKTAARTLPLSDRLTEVLHEWITHYRAKIPGARLHPYLIVSSDSGKPMSLSNVNKIMERLRKLVPDLPDNLTPHVLRHSWNDWFSNKMDAAGVSEDQEIKWRKRLMGWRDENSARHYLARTVRRRSNEVLREMQEQLELGQGGENGSQ